MKKITILLISFFISFSSAYAEIDIAAALQSGQSEQEVLTELTASGMDIADAVEAMIKASPENTLSIVATAIASAPEQTVAITAAAISAAPEKASAIRKEALIAAPTQATAINQVSQLASDPTENLTATSSGPKLDVATPTFFTPTSTPTSTQTSGGGGVAASPA